jgi:putative hydrolase of the HAD superfamily
MQLSGIRVILFDATGTLLHPHPGAAEMYAQIGGRHGSQLQLDEIARRFAFRVADEERHDRQHGLRTSEAREQERWRRIVANVLTDLPDPEACFQDLYVHFGRPDAWRLEAGTAETLSRLALRGYRLALASNYDQRLHSVMAGFPELRLLDPIFISSEIGWRKPAPEFFAHICTTLEMQPEEVLHVGDDPHNDYEGARSAGLQAVLFDPKGKAEDVPRRVSRLDEVLGLMLCHTGNFR